MFDLTLSFLNLNFIDDFINFSHLKNSLSFKKIKLDYQQQELNANNVTLFTQNLQQLLMILSTKNVNELHITNLLRVDIIDFEMLTLFIKQSSITTLIIFEQQNERQLIFKDLVEENLKTKKIKRKLPQTSILKKKLIHKKVQQLTNFIDVELQEEQQQCVAIEIAISNEQEVIIEVNENVEILEPKYNMQQFAQAYSDALHNKDYYINLWCNWVGALTSRLEHCERIFITVTACEELFLYQNKFTSGFLDRLPPGFSQKIIQNNFTVITFDARLKLLTSYNPLQIQTVHCASQRSDDDINIENTWLQTFSTNEKIWYQCLKKADLNKHGVEIIDLIQAFIAFKQQLINFSTDDQQPLSFYPECNLSTKEHPIMVLSRMLSLLEHVDIINRQAQWLEITDLDFSSTGFIKLLTKPYKFCDLYIYKSGTSYAKLDAKFSLNSFAFVTKEMNINKDVYLTKLVYGREYFDLYSMHYNDNDGFQSINKQVDQWQGDQLVDHLETRQYPYNIANNYYYKCYYDLETHDVCLDDAIYSNNSGQSKLLILFSPEDFFGYMAFQYESLQMPLKFCRYAYDEITGSDFAPQIKDRLYRIIAMQASSMFGEIQQISFIEFQRDLQQLLNLIKQIKNETVTIYLLSSCVKCNVFISIAIINNLIIANMEELIKSRSFMFNYSTFRYGDEFYLQGVLNKQSAWAFRESFKDYTLDDYKSGLVGEHNAFIIRYLRIPEGIHVQLLISMISSFDLSKIAQNVESILQKFNHDNPRLLELFRILRNINIINSKQPKLTHDDLLDIINTVEIQTNSSVIDIIKTFCFKNGKFIIAYLPNNYCIHYNNCVLPLHLQRRIIKQFPYVKQQVFNILQAIGDEDSYNNLVNLIMALCKPLTMVEQNIFIKQIESLPDLYKHKQDFIMLLEFIQKNNLQNQMLNFITVVNKNTHKNQLIDLTKKANFYLNDVVPILKELNKFYYLQFTTISLNTLLFMPENYFIVVKNMLHLNQFIITYPMYYIIELYDKYLTEYNINTDFIQYIYIFILTLYDYFDKSDPEVLQALCLKFSTDTTLKIQNFLLILQLTADYPIVLKITSNTNDYNLDVIDQLMKVIDNFYDQKDVVINTLDKIYQFAPFLKITTLLDCNAKCSGADNYVKELGQLYSQYTLHPSDRDPRNTFDPNKHFEIQIDLNRYKSIIDEISIMSLSDLLLSYYKIKYDYMKLVAIAAEILHRSLGDFDLESQTGDSMELNTTQYVAVFWMIQNNNHLISQIATGEGKSRIMMVAIACQFILGKTVDFVTSDMQLATRDYMKTRAYWQLLQAKVGIIFSNTPANHYNINGINFSDAANINLFRNKAYSEGLDDLVIDPCEKQRCLLLDEGDQVFFYTYAQRFNFSTSGDKNLCNISWIYDLLIQYFSEEDRVHLFYDDFEQCRLNFMQFVKSQQNADQYLPKLNLLSTIKIDQWLEAAVNTLALKYEEDFKIKPDILIKTPYGPKISSQAQLLVSKRIDTHPTFSFGVQQLLHARLNLARQLLNVPDMNEVLSQCLYEFYIADEKQMIYTTNSKNFLDSYSHGVIKAVTGTAGSDLELFELTKLYNMKFIDIPKHYGLKRVDKNIYLTKDDKQQINVLINEINVARAQQQPILIITESDAKSVLLYNVLKQKFNDKIQLINNDLSAEQEQQHINIAGMPKQITISTTMVGRGTDFKLLNEAKKYGLKVLVTYLQTKSEMLQSYGRSGRCGDPGDSLMILTKSQLQNIWNFQSANDSFFANTEYHIALQQAKLDKKFQNERLVQFIVGDFKKALRDKWFKNKEHKKRLSEWTKFLSDFDQLWMDTWPEIQSILLCLDVNNFDIIRNLLQKFKFNILQKFYLMKIDSNLELDINLVHKEILLQAIEIKNLSNIYNYYHPSHDGRAVKYTNWYIPYIASIKWWLNLLPLVEKSLNTRRPFANTCAWLEGRGQIFAELRVNKHRGKIIGINIGGMIGAITSIVIISAMAFNPLLIGIIIAATIIAAAMLGLLIGACIDKRRNNGAGFFANTKKQMPTILIQSESNNII